jgi:hypothetical protein
MNSQYVEQSGTTGVLFPLTPALSLRERENNRQRLRETGTQVNVKRLTPILPLPGGEGRGEGERCVGLTLRRGIKPSSSLPTDTKG